MLNGELESSFGAAICDTIQGLVVLLDPQGRILRWNLRCEQVTGYALTEVQCAPFWEILPPPEDRARIRENFEQLCCADAERDGESIWVARDGSRRSVSWANTVIRGESGGVRYILGTGIDITARKSAADALADREHRLSRAMEGSKDGFWEWDLGTGEIQFTPRCAAILGFEPHELDLHIRSFFSRLHPDDEREAQAAIAGHLQGLTPYYEGDCRMRVKDGSWKWVAITGRAVARDEDGRPARLGGSITDIQERKEMEERLRWESDCNRAIADLSTALASSCPLEQFSDRVLEAGKRLTGSSAGFTGYVNPESGHFVSRTGAHFETVFRDCSALWAWVLNNRRPVLTNDAPSDPRQTCAGASTVRFLAAPALVGEAAVGMLALANPDRDYQSRDLELVQKLANLYALALQRQRSEEAALRANQKLRAVFEAAPVAIVSVDIEDRVETWNPAAERMFGWTAAEVTGRPLPILPRPELPATAALHQAAMRGEPVSNVEQVRIHKDGSAVEVSLSASTIFDPAGKVTGFIVAYLDAAGPKRAEIALRQSEERYRALFERNPHPMWVVDLENGRFLAVNEAAVRQYGFSSEEFARIDIGELHPPEEAGLLEGARERVAAGQASHRETRHFTKTGAVIDVECFCNPFVFAGRPAALTLTLDVTSRKRMEKAHRESERRYQDLVDNFSVGVYRSTPDGRVLMANPALLKMMGYSSLEELSARNLEEDGFEPDAPRSRFRQSLEANGAITYDACWRRLDGTTLSVREYAKALRGDDGRVMYYEGVVEDITDRRRGEETLRENEERFRHLFEEAPIAYHEIDREGIIRAVNQAECALLGLKKDQVLNRPVWSLLAPGERDVSRRAVAAKFAGKQPLVPLQREYQHANGSIRFFEIHENFIHDAGGAVVGIRSAMVDITERKRVEHALRWNEARFRAVFEGAAMGIVTTDLRGRLTAMNPAMERMVGYRQAELRGRHFGVLALPEDRERDAPLHAELMSGQRDHLQLEKQYVCKDGTTIWVRVSASLVRDTESRPDFVVGMIEDITERKKAEEALRRTVDELARSNAELEHFAYVASHDLQEPLRMVTSFMQLLRRRYQGKLDEDADEFITYAVEGSSRMKALIDDLLTYSRLGARSKPLVPAQSRYAVEQAAANLAAAIDESGAVLTIDDGLPEIMADAGQLVQLFQNLIGNAVKFRREVRPEISVKAERADGAWVFSVRDNGIGIEERHRERVFEIFSRLHTKSDYPGSGIGLAVSKKIVERHCGDIGVESEPGVGSTFWFSIPDNAVARD